VVIAAAVVTVAVAASAAAGAKPAGNNRRSIKTQGAIPSGSRPFFIYASIHRSIYLFESLLASSQR
jgi:hypothetical protein